MPELPEVQTIADDLNKKIVGRRIVGVWCNWPKLVKFPGFHEFERQIKGFKIARVTRRAKNLLIYGTEGYLLLIHHKMTGHLLVGKWEIKKTKSEEMAIPVGGGLLQEKVNGYIHLIFYFDDGSMLGLSDLRKFAKVLFGPADYIEKNNLEKLGPEPLDRNFTFKKFKPLLSKEKGKIKIVLMDQNVIAGIGNIYSDDILWLAKIHPLRKTDSLSDKEIKNLYSAIKIVLKKALKLRGSSISDFRDVSGRPGGYADKSFVYQKEGEGCPRSNGTIQRIKIGGRSARYCPICQKV
jgi:formamidopyrimidine-DNA glycosylase